MNLKILFFVMLAFLSAAPAVVYSYSGAETCGKVAGSYTTSVQAGNTGLCCWSDRAWCSIFGLGDHNGQCYDPNEEVCCPEKNTITLKSGCSPLPATTSTSTTSTSTTTTSSGTASTAGGSVQKEVWEGETASVSCPSGTITSIKKFYFCPGDSRSTESCSGLSGGVGQTSASINFNNNNCGDPCSGIRKKGILSASCSGGTTSGAASGGTIISGGIESDVWEGETASVSCGGVAITSLGISYYCPNDPRSTSSCSGLSGGVGQASASINFNNNNCGDPCSGIRKRGKLSAACAVIVPKFPAPAEGGFNANYFRGINFDIFKTSRTFSIGGAAQDNVAMGKEWGSSYPDNVADVDVNSFSIGYSGNMVFTGGDYEFYTSSDDGSRLYIDGSLAVDNWRDQGMTKVSAKKMISAGKHKIEVEFYERYGDAGLLFGWVQTSKPACTASDWRCTDFGACQRTSTTARTCTKIKDCAGDTGKPAESQACTYYCQDGDWNVGAFGECLKGTQTRTVTKNVACEGDGGKPKASQACTPKCTSEYWVTWAWGACSSDGIKTRVVEKTAPCDGDGGKPSATDVCTPPCTSTDWSCIISYNPADFNKDGVVSDADSDLFNANFGTSNAQYDLSKNGRVGLDDFFIFAGHYGTATCVDNFQKQTCTKTKTCDGGYTPPSQVSCTRPCTQNDWSYNVAQDCNAQYQKKVSWFKAAACTGGWSPPSDMVECPKPACTREHYTCTLQYDSADFNKDGVVDVADINLFNANFGINNALYDLSKNGRVDFDDFFILSERYGMSTCIKQPDNTGKGNVECTKTGICDDSNGYKPPASELCTLPVCRWDCETPGLVPWGTCSNSKQTRTCKPITQNCISGTKPAEEQACDSTPPVITGTGPSGTQTTRTITLTASTNENSKCRYSTSGLSYSQMNAANQFTIGERTQSHSSIVTVNNDGSHIYFISCEDISGNQMVSFVPAAFNVDTTPPSIIQVGPPGTVKSKTVTLTARTDENAECRYSETPGGYNSMPSANKFSSTGGIGHSTTITTDMGARTYYVSCTDSRGNAMTGSSIISFAVNSPPSVNKVSFTGDCKTGGKITVKCDASDTNQDPNSLGVSGWIGTCNNGNCFNTRNFVFSGGDPMTYESGNIFRSSEISLNVPVGTAIAATCLAKDSFDETSNWGDGYPVCIVDKCVSNPTFRISFSKNPAVKGSLDITLNSDKSISGNPAVTVNGIGAATFKANPAFGIYMYSIAIGDSIPGGSYDVSATGSDSNGCSGNSIGTVIVCSNNEHVENGKCVANACSLDTPTNAALCIGDNSNVGEHGLSNAVVDDSCTQRKCEYICNSGYHKYQNTCVSNSCEGIPPTTTAGTAKGAATFTSGSAKTWSYLDAPVAPPACTWKCESPLYERKENGCVSADKTPPQTAISLTDTTVLKPFADQKEPTKSFDISISDSDDMSGLQKCEYRINSPQIGDWKTRDCNSRFTVRIPQDCGVEGTNTCTFQARATDAAGNINQAVSKSFSIRMTPACTADSWASKDVTGCRLQPADFNSDGDVDFDDMFLLADKIGYYENYDVNGDGVTDSNDKSFLSMIIEILTGKREPVFIDPSQPTIGIEQRVANEYRAAKSFIDGSLSGVPITDTDRSVQLGRTNPEKLDSLVQERFKEYDFSGDGRIGNDEELQDTVYPAYVSIDGTTTMSARGFVVQLDMILKGKVSERDYYPPAGCSLAKEFLVIGQDCRYKNGYPPFDAFSKIQRVIYQKLKDFDLNGNGVLDDRDSDFMSFSNYLPFDINNNRLLDQSDRFYLSSVVKMSKGMLQMDEYGFMDRYKFQKGKLPDRIFIVSNPTFRRLDFDNDYRLDADDVNAIPEGVLSGDVKYDLNNDGLVNSADLDEEFQKYFGKKGEKTIKWTKTATCRDGVAKPAQEDVSCDFPACTESDWKRTGTGLCIEQDASGKPIVQWERTKACTGGFVPRCPPISGQCSPVLSQPRSTQPATAELCNVGTPSDISALPTGWTWTCRGFNEGTAASCLTPRILPRTTLSCPAGWVRGSASITTTDVQASRCYYSVSTAGSASTRERTCNTPITLSQADCPISGFETCTVSAYGTLDDGTKGNAYPCTLKIDNIIPQLSVACQPDAAKCNANTKTCIVGAQFTITSTASDALSGIASIKVTKSDITIGDFNNDGRVDEKDLAAFGDAFKAANSKFDLNKDQIVNLDDFFIFADNFGGKSRTVTATGDFNSDGTVDGRDFAAFADAFKAANSKFDLNNDKRMDFNDFFLFADDYGKVIKPTSAPNPKLDLNKDGEIDFVDEDIIYSAVEVLKGKLKRPVFVTKQECFTNPSLPDYECAPVGEPNAGFRSMQGRYDRAKEFIDTRLLDADFDGNGRVDEKDMEILDSVIQIDAGTKATNPSTDFDKDGFVNYKDFRTFSDAFIAANSKFDLNKDQIVNLDDFFIFADNFGGKSRTITTTGDFNNDGKVDGRDLDSFTKALEASNSKFDVNTDGKINFDDFFKFVDNFGKSVQDISSQSPTSSPATYTTTHMVDAAGDISFGATATDRTGNTISLIPESCRFKIIEDTGSITLDRLVVVRKDKPVSFDLFTRFADAFGLAKGQPGYSEEYNLYKTGTSTDIIDKLDLFKLFGYVKRS